ncbi:MAG: hypothetical protein C0625_12960 [Arcobacter sp.]|nr:MAG: hypothetical protein C0625_12960 [Arcobacter sp.]
MNSNRRLLIKQAAILSFALGVNANASKVKEKTINTDVDYRYSPQFYIGNPNAKTRIDFLYSVRCKDTRKFTKDILNDLVKSAYKSNELCIIFHHIVKQTDKELASAIELMNVSPDKYPYLMYSLLNWSGRKGKGIGIKRTKKFKKKLGYPNDGSFNSENAKLMLSVIRIHAEENGVIESPSVFINNKLHGMQLDREAFLTILEDETGYIL